MERREEELVVVWLAEFDGFVALGAFGRGAKIQFR